MKRMIWDGAKLIAIMAFADKDGEQVAAAIGVTRQVVSNYRNGIAPRPERVTALAKALECKETDFYSEVK